MKTFNISEEEKKRILTMHSNKKNNINEQELGNEPDFEELDNEVPQAPADNTPKKQIDSRRAEIRLTKNTRQDEYGKLILDGGFEALFNALPNSIDTLFVECDDSFNLALDVPETISKFKGLESLMFVNCIKSLPESIGELASLMFISLPNNPSLEFIPRAVLDLPKIVFINLKGSNPKVPRGFRDVYKQGAEGTRFYIKRENTGELGLY